jgi:hypothetical protein
MFHRFESISAMKIARHLFSDAGILASTVLLLMISASLSIAGIGIEMHNQAAGFPPVVLGGDIDLPHYVLQAVMGQIPSTAGTLQSFGMALGFIVTPFVAALMIAIKGSIEHADRDTAKYVASKAAYAV